MSLTSETLNGGPVRFVFFPIDLDVFYVSNMIYLPGMVYWPESDPTYWIFSVCWYFGAKNWSPDFLCYYICFRKLYMSF